MTVSDLFVDGAPVRVGARIGKGGEGEVYALADHPARALKFYTAHDSGDREAKVSATVGMRLAERTALVAFPIALVRNRRGRFVGFVMNLVREHQPLFELYAPGARKQKFPEASYRFLVRAALNVARAIAAVHDTGCVIGDINHSGILISKQAIAALIDADSFQIVNGANRYMCRVGVPEYTPPELQGMKLGNVVRTPDHDAFGLAVAVFQLLTMGRHPYVGHFVKGDLPIEKAIAEHRFVFSLQRQTGMTPPPGACTLNDFPRPVAAAFEAAFHDGKGTARPTAKQWVALLTELEGSLVKCKSNSLHHYSSSGSECPWCRMEKRLGNVLFLPTYAGFATVGQTTDPNKFDINQLWAQIDAIKLPPRSHISPILTPVSCSPSQSAQSARSKQHHPTLTKAAGVLAGLAVLIANPAGWFISIALVWAGFALARRFDTGHLKDYMQQLNRIDDEWRRAVTQWEQRCGLDRVDGLLASLRASRRAYEDLNAEEKERINKYQNERHHLQLRQFLDGFRIRDYRIKGIGAAKLTALMSYGIETAADVNSSAVQAVPGFGPVNSQPLLAWAQDCHRDFSYNSQTNAADRAEVNAIRADIQQRGQELRDSIAKDASEYVRAAQLCKQMIATPDPQLTAVLQRRGQLEADCKHLGIAVGPLPAYVPKAPTTTLNSGTAGRVTPQSVNSRAASQRAPKCPHCGQAMVQRRARRGAKVGNTFWGCSRYPVCRGTRP